MIDPRAEPGQMDSCGPSTAGAPRTPYSLRTHKLHCFVTPNHRQSPPPSTTQGAGVQVAFIVQALLLTPHPASLYVGFLFVLFTLRHSTALL